MIYNIQDVKHLPEIQEMMEKIASGELVPSTGGEIPEWTPEEISRLDAVLSRFYEQNKEAKNE